MPPTPDLSKLSVRQFAERFRGEMIPLSNNFSYYCASAPMTEEDLKEYLEEPVSALPPSVVAVLPKISILLVPYIEKTGTTKARTEVTDYVSTEKPPEGRTSPAAQVQVGDATVMAFALKGYEVAEYHYRFYHLLSAVVGAQSTEEVETRFSRILREELTADVHGEVDEESWRIKQGLRRSKGASVTGAALKAFRTYARQSFVDTLTLYLHGICCDIDVDTGPRQLPSRHLRKRLAALEELFPPPAGYAVFPEQLQP
jgi:hypothetical protein